VEIKTDFLVLGSGIAGLSFAIKAAELGTVAIVTKKEKFESNTNYAQGGIAAVHDRMDSFEEHIRDTLACGDGLCHDDVVRFVVAEGPDRIAELVHWGVEFTRAGDDTSVYDLGQEGGHSKRRVLHARDLTGREIERALIDKTGDRKNIRIYENHIAIDLIMKSTLTGRKGTNRDQCLGAYVFDIQRKEVLPPATALPWPTGRGRKSQTWSSCSFIPPVFTTRMPNHSSSVRRSGERAGS
jgi:L-aspartate oxidase